MNTKILKSKTAWTGLAAIIAAAGGYFTGSMDIGTAIQAMKSGCKIAREGWNGKGMFLYYIPAGEYSTRTKVAKETFGEKAAYRSYIAMKTVDNEVVPWTYCYEDCR